MAKLLRYDQLLQLAVAEGATSPNPGLTGVVAWSTSLSKLVAWNGSTWNAVASAGGSGDVVGPASATNNALAIFDGTTGKLLKDNSAIKNNSTETQDSLAIVTTKDFSNIIVQKRNGLNSLLANMSLLTGTTSTVITLSRSDPFQTFRVEYSDSTGPAIVAETNDPLSFYHNTVTTLKLGTLGQLGVGGSGSYGTAGQVLVSGGPSAAATWTTFAGGGDVVGPASSTDGHLLVSSGTTGKVLREATWFDSPATSIPAAPAAGDLRWFARDRAGRILPHIIGPSGIDVALQPALFGNTTYMWLPGTGTTVAINWGTSWTARNAGTGAAQAHPTKASTNALTSLSRATFGTGTTATGSSGIQSSASVAWRGNAANLGGFFFFARFGVETHEAAMRYMIGLSALNAALAGEPSVQNNTIALCKDSTDTNWQFVTRGTTTTKTPTTLAVSAGPILDLTIFAPPNGSNITVRLVNAVDGTVYMDNVVISANLPTNTTFLNAHAQCMSTVGTTAKLLALNRIYVECDL